VGKLKRATSSKPKPREQTPSASPKRASSHTVYQSFTAIWNGKKAPVWHPVKKMRYVFWRMMNGATVLDGIEELHWSGTEFWHLVDKDTKGNPFQLEYKRAKIIQARAFADSVVLIGDGRDRLTKRSMRKMRKLIEKGFKRAKGQKTALGAKAILSHLLDQIDRNDNRIIQRNKIQIDAAKWIAKTGAPHEYGDKTAMSLGSPDPDGSETQQPITIQFVGPDGKVAKL
jgi:hypothetical protein